jgi:hypothetical protein
VAAQQQQVQRRLVLGLRWGRLQLAVQGLELLVAQWSAAVAMVWLHLMSDCSEPGLVQIGGSRRAVAAQQLVVTQVCRQHKCF